MQSRIFFQMLAPVLLAAAAFTSNPARAQNKLNVPFSFTAAGKIFPPGNYTVRTQLDGNFVLLASKTPPRSYTWVLLPGDPDPTDRRVILKFDESGGSYTLRSIQYGSMVTSRLDGKSAGSKRALSVTGLGQ